MGGFFHPDTSPFFRLSRIAIPASPGKCINFVWLMSSFFRQKSLALYIHVSHQNSHNKLPIRHKRLSFTCLLAGFWNFIFLLLCQDLKICKELKFSWFEKLSGSFTNPIALQFSLSNFYFYDHELVFSSHTSLLAFLTHIEILSFFWKSAWCKVILK